ncbi:sulfatase-like hydrolase/transferase [bacterium]|nr:sulfatase-like hydrolase/transferase [bacterium]
MILPDFNVNKKEYLISVSIPIFIAFLSLNHFIFLRFYTYGFRLGHYIGSYKLLLIPLFILIGFFIYISISTFILSTILKLKINRAIYFISIPFISFFIFNLYFIQMIKPINYMGRSLICVTIMLYLVFLIVYILRYLKKDIFLFFKMILFIISIGFIILFSIPKNRVSVRKKKFYVDPYHILKNWETFNTTESIYDHWNFINKDNIVVKKIKHGNTIKNCCYIYPNDTINCQSFIKDNSRLEFSILNHPFYDYYSVYVLYQDMNNRSRKKEINILNNNKRNAIWINLEYKLSGDINDKYGIGITFERSDAITKIDTNANYDAPIILEIPRICLPRESDEKNVILISIDTFRADHLSCYGYKRITTPNIDRFSENSVIFKNAYASSSWTAPSHMSMFTGMPAILHGISGKRPEIYKKRLDNSIHTITQVLKENGYQTAAFTGGGFVSGQFGFDKGFDTYTQIGRTLHTEIDIEVQQTIQWLRKHQNEKFFLFFHTYEVHAPYTHNHFIEQNAYSSDKQRNIDAYDSDILYTDRMLGVLFNELERLDLFKNTLIILTSDHGEEFGEHYDWKIYDAHAHSLYNEVLNIPMILYGSNIPQSIISDNVSHIDIFPTILEYLNIRSDSSCKGQSLLGFLI